MTRSRSLDGSEVLPACRLLVVFMRRPPTRNSIFHLIMKFYCILLLFTIEMKHLLPFYHVYPSYPHCIFINEHMTQWKHNYVFMLPLVTVFSRAQVLLSPPRSPTRHAVHGYCIDSSIAGNSLQRLHLSALQGYATLSTCWTRRSRIDLVTASMLQSCCSSQYWPHLVEDIS